MSRSEVSVDPELCIGSAECVRLLPAAFRIDESRGVAVALPEAAVADRPTLLRVRRNCPTHAIEVSDERGLPIPDAGDDR